MFTQDSFISRCGGAGVEATIWELESLVKLRKAQKSHNMNMMMIVDDDDDDDDYYYYHH